MSRSTIVASIDDTDPRVEYSGDWAVSSNISALDNIGFWGAVVNGTAHEGRQAGSSLKFEFDGIAIGFYGSYTSTGNGSAPKYTCRIDGVAFDTQAYLYDSWETNAYPFCGELSLLDGHHTATLTIDSLTSDASGQVIPLVFDTVMYWPSPGAKLNDTTEQIEFNDTRITFSAGWSVYGGYDYQHYASQRASTVKLAFEGQSATMYSFIPNGTFTEGTGTYTLDNNQPVTFTVPASKSLTTAYYNQPYFNLNGLSKGQHTLTVTDNTDHSGRFGQSPLTLSYFEIRGFPADSGGGGGSVLSTGAIAGIAVGGVVVLGVISGLLVFFFIVKPRRRASGQTAVSQHWEKPNGPVTPSSADPFFAYNTPQSPPFTPGPGGYSPNMPSYNQQQQQTPAVPHLQTVASPPGQPFASPSYLNNDQPSHNPHGSSTTTRPTIQISGSDHNDQRSPYSPSSEHIGGFIPSPSSPNRGNLPPPSQQVLSRTDSGLGTQMAWRPPSSGGASQSGSYAGPGDDTSISALTPRRPASKDGNTSSPVVERFTQHTDSGVRMEWKDPQREQQAKLDPVRYVDVPPQYQEL